MKETPWKKIALTAILVPVVLAIGLNFVLQWKVFDFDIIGNNSEEGAPQVWLMFWGTLSAAVSTCVMAYVSYKQNQDILKQSQSLHIKSDLEKQYDSFEEFLRKCEDVYSLRRLIAIIKCFDDTKPKASNYLNLFNKLENSVKLKTIQIERFDVLLEKETDFRSSASSLNKEYKEVISVLKNDLDVINCRFISGKDVNDDVQVVQAQIEKLYDETVQNHYDNLFIQGNRILEKLLYRINQIM